MFTRMRSWILSFLFVSSQFLRYYVHEQEFEEMCKYTGFIFIRVVLFLHRLARSIYSLRFYTKQLSFKPASELPVLLVQCICTASLHFPRTQHRKVYAGIEL